MITKLKDIDKREEFTFTDAQNFSHVRPIYQVGRLSVRDLVQFDVSCLWINGEPVVRVQTLNIPTAEISYVCKNQLLKTVVM